MKNIALVVIFIACVVFSAQYVGTCIDQQAEPTKTEHKTIEIDLSYADKWPVKKWKIRNRFLECKSTP